MTDQIEELFRDLRTETLSTIIPPGPGAARLAVRRKREIRAAAGSVLAVAVVAVGVGAVRHRDAGEGMPAAQASGPPAEQPVQQPAPDPAVLARGQAAQNALGDPNRHPWVMATGAVMSGADYENDINDIGEDKYYLYVFCAGPGRLQVTIKADQYGDKVLATGTVPCQEKPTGTRLTVTQPHTGYLRLFAHAEDGAADAAAFAFKFARTD
jgi:hypothetical protein